MSGCLCTEGYVCANHTFYRLPEGGIGVRTPQPQWIITAPDGTELLVSFWGGIDDDPECAPRIDDTRWGVPLPVRRIA